MLNFKNAALRRGTRLLFERVNLTIHRGEKVGITGANGIGKSSLLALIRGDLHSDEGTFSMPPGLVIAHVAQETPAVDAAAIDYVIEGDEALCRLQGELQEAESAGDGVRQAELLARLESIDGYAARSRAARLMHGLGFAAGDEQAPVSSFSGGWRMRLNLARALMCRSDLLLLDEPTNHLDLDAVIWLQDWLRAYQGTLLLISHDRDFLDEVVDHIAHVVHGTVTLFGGNYSVFERRRAEMLSQQQSAHEKQQREMEHIRRFVDRFRSKATKARQVQSRLKAMEKMERIVQAHVDSPFDFAFRKPDSTPNPLLQLDEVSAGYDDRPVLRDVTFDLLPGDRIGLLGPNGAGKSTLIKLLADMLRPLSGRKRAAQGLRIGYFAQHQVEQLQLEESPLHHFQRLDPQAKESDLRHFLGGFAFSGERALEPAAHLSGGEKARLVLALIAYQKPNLLLLDEPTNHLDLELRHALGMALQDFEGAMVLVSHDRHLLRTVTDRLFLVIDGAVQPYDGDLDDYRQWLLTQRQERLPDSKAASADLSRKERRRLDAENRQKLRPLRQGVTQAERMVDRLLSEQEALDEQLADSALYAPSEKERLLKLLQQKRSLEQRLERAEEAWIEAQQALDAVQQAEEKAALLP
jgi:ATP-binding cassette, subfamily F, member 3